MGTRASGSALIVFAAALPLVLAPFARAEFPWPFAFPEQKEIHVRDPSELPRVPIPDSPPPATVADESAGLPPAELSLDDAIRTALANSQVVRVLAGVTAVSSGRTIYDTAIVNNGVDEQQARFDPRIQAQNSFNRTETPQAAFDPLDPSRAALFGLRSDDYRLDAGWSQPIVTGGTVNLGVTTAPTRSQPGVFPLNPQNRSSLELSLTQPLLQGGGWRANMAPIVLARIDSERSFFQFKDAVQELVRGVIEAYWSLVFARTDVWARQQQVKYLERAYALAQARSKVGIVSGAVVAQSRVAYWNTRASLIASRANLLQREAALRNILGLPPQEMAEIVPTTPPTRERLEMDWGMLLQLASQQRPDIIELKLILEADEQLLLQARNQALPRADAVALYRWNGLEGEMPVGLDLSSQPGQFSDWTLAVNFSVPLGLRRERAQLRRQELLISRDRANLQQGLHAASHVLAANLRNQALYYEQYQAFKETRAAARFNLEQQLAEYDAQRVIFLNVLLAVTDWGNAVSAEAQSLLAYNTELASIERQTGTILESHNVRFYEERFGSLGPLGRLGPWHCYPSSLPPEGGADHYPRGTLPSESTFDLESPVVRPAPAPPPAIP